MSQRKLSRVTAAGFLVALLVLPGAASARTAQRSGTFGVLEWLGGLWGKGVHFLTVHTGGEAKQGLGVDPNGKPTPPPENGVAGDSSTEEGIHVAGGNG